MCARRLKLQSIMKILPDYCKVKKFFWRQDILFKHGSVAM